MRYRHEATSLRGFIQTIAVAFVARGYYFYVAGEVPAGKELAKVDAKLMERYGVGISKFTRARRKKAGLASVQYIRHKGSRQFAIFATHGQSAFFENEARVIRDVRRVPFKYGGYSVSYKQGHVHVRVEKLRYMELKAYLIQQATRVAVENLSAEMKSLLNFEPYAPIRSQMLCIWRAVCRARKEAGLLEVSKDCLRLRRHVVKPFEECSKDS